MKRAHLSFWIVILAPALLFAGPLAPAETDAFTGRRPKAVIDLATREGVQLVQGQWRYSDVKIVEVGFKAAGPDGQPTGAPNKAYDFIPHAGGADFDDSKWEVLDPAALDKRRGSGRLSFNWYRITITVPERIGQFNPSGATVVFETSVDDYAEIWVDGEIPRGLGQSGGSVIKGWNAANRLVIGRNVKPGQKIQLAIFGINGPISNPPTNYIYMRYARLEFHKGAREPAAEKPREVNVELVRLDPAIDAVVPPNPKIYKIAEGFESIQELAWKSDGGYLLLRDLGAERTYKYTLDARLMRLNSKDRQRHSSDSVPVMITDQQGNLYLADREGIKVLSPLGKHMGTIVPPKRPQHLAWGDADYKTLFMTSGSKVYRMRLNTPGRPNAEQTAN